MTSDNGGERESLAPVIPLFGGPAPQRPEPRGWRGGDDTSDDGAGVDAARAETEIEIETAAEVAADESDLAPTPQTVDRWSTAAQGDRTDPRWHPTWASDRDRLEPGIDDVADGASRAELGEKALLKKLRTRSLSVAEARGVLREHELDDAATEAVLASMEEYGYLNDAALAEQLVHVGVDRKGQGRQLIGQTLAKRGIPRDVADAALSALPDDDLERALEFARGKARSLRDVDRDTALRRLSGQLARRGYGGSLAMTAARIVLDENPARTTGVRFR